MEDEDFLSGSFESGRGYHNSSWKAAVGDGFVLPQFWALPKRVGLFYYYYPLRLSDLGYGHYAFSESRRGKTKR